MLDAATLATVSTFSLFGEEIAPVELSPSLLLNFGQSAINRVTVPGGEPTITPVPGLTGVRSFTLPAPGNRAFAVEYDSRGERPDTITVVDLEAASIRSRFVPARAPSRILNTPWGAQSCTYRIDSAYASFPEVPAASVPIRMTTDCAWRAATADAWLHLDTSAGASTATVRITADANTTGRTRQGRVTIGGQVVTVTQAGTDSTPSYGVIDTPADFTSGVTGSLAITGWALDDVGVARVLLYRDPLPGEPDTLVPIGTATLVEGARPDVQAAFASVPFASRAGWGYMLLTNMLPGGGSGTYRLHAIAEDIEGRLTTLGTRTFSAANNTASLPFGALDTPGQGEVVSGTITNWGWALTPQPGFIPADGSTIDVVVDGIAIGRPVFGFDRVDIAALFPGYANTNSAVEYFTLDTRTLSNGVHTIAWVVRDNLGRVQGIGSRYFTVAND